VQDRIRQYCVSRVLTSLTPLASCAKWSNAGRGQLAYLGGQTYSLRDPSGATALQYESHVRASAACSVLDDPVHCLADPLDLPGPLLLPLTQHMTLPATAMNRLTTHMCNELSQASSGIEATSSKGLVWQRQSRAQNTQRATATMKQGNSLECVSDLWRHSQEA